MENFQQKLFFQKQTFKQFILNLVCRIMLRVVERNVVFLLQIKEGLCLKKSLGNLRLVSSTYNQCFWWCATGWSKIFSKLWKAFAYEEINVNIWIVDETKKKQWTFQFIHTRCTKIKRKRVFFKRNGNTFSTWKKMNNILFQTWFSLRRKKNIKFFIIVFWNRNP